jgi:uncharacterized protein (DUF2235 family)
MPTSKKRLVACSDGTWNSSDKSYHTNVELFYNSIPDAANDGLPQVKMYDAGVGSNSADKEDEIIGGLTGKGIDKNIKDVYTFLVANYKAGDDIFLFGFSRGAYTARSVAGLINNCGILKPENIHLVDKVYEQYRSRDKKDHPQSVDMTSFRQTFCIEPETSIYFIGVWDTVGSLGFPWAKKQNAERYQFHDVKLNSKTTYAYHALAIDECRSEFAPTLWEKSDTAKTTTGHAQVLEQRWFPGVHSNVGGGYDDTRLSDLALCWLLEKARDAKLTAYPENLGKIEPFKSKYKYQPDYTGTLYNSMKWYYRLFFSNPLRTLLEEKNGAVTNQVVDESAEKRFNDPAMKYNPKNLKAYMKSRNAVKS